MSGEKEFEHKSELDAAEKSQAEAQKVETGEESVSGEQSLPEQIVELQQQLASAKEDVLRAKADEQNTIRRTQLDIEKVRKFALDGFVRELLPVVDNLERAVDGLDIPESEASAYVEGVELTLKSLISVLEKNQVEVIDPLGEPFNPELHQAVSSVNKPDAEPNSVLDVFQKGYQLNGRLIRPAMVVVSSAG